MMQKNSKDNKIEIRDLGKIAVSEMLDWQRMSEKYERVGLRSIAEGKLALVLLAGGQNQGRRCQLTCQFIRLKRT